MRDAVARRASGFESFGVEQVPELQEDEGREEYRELAHGGLARRVEPPAEHSEQDDHEDRAAGGDRAHHRPRDDARIAPAGAFAHHFVLRRQRCHGHGRQRVHDDVDPQDLRHRERHFGLHD